jgi:hypothetical protein
VVALGVELARPIGVPHGGGSHSSPPENERSDTKSFQQQRSHFSLIIHSLPEPVIMVLLTEFSDLLSSCAANTPDQPAVPPTNNRSCVVVCSGRLTRVCTRRREGDEGRKTLKALPCTFLFLCAEASRGGGGCGGAGGGGSEARLPALCQRSRAGHPAVAFHEVEDSRGRGGGAPAVQSVVVSRSSPPCQPGSGGSNGGGDSGASRCLRPRRC